jgi:hypothetical protein
VEGQHRDPGRGLPVLRWQQGKTDLDRTQAGRRPIQRHCSRCGEARGIASGNALNWRYVLALKVDGRTWEVDFDDWMYQIDDRVMLNRATMSKFGVKLGEVLLSFTRRAA